MNRMFPVLMLAAVALGGGAMATPYTPAGRDPDWPCAQLLVPVLAPGSYWDGAVPTGTAWRDDEALFSLVTDLVDRDTPDADALAKLSAYADSVPVDRRAVAYPLLLSALVDQTNDARSVLITRIKQLGARQRRMGDVIAKISTEADDASQADPRRKDLMGERDFDVRAFQETQHTMRYACEAPADMERRLGVFAGALKARMRRN